MRPVSVDLTVFDATGRMVKSLVRGAVVPGEYSVRWNSTDERGKQVPAGVYFLRLFADRSLTARIVLSR